VRINGLHQALLGTDDGGVFGVWEDGFETTQGTTAWRGMSENFPKLSNKSTYLGGRSEICSPASIDPFQLGVWFYPVEVVTRGREVGS
jgi:hypothetical protein